MNKFQGSFRANKAPRYLKERSIIVKKRILVQVADHFLIYEKPANNLSLYSILIVEDLRYSKPLSIGTEAQHDLFPLPEAGQRGYALSKENLEA